MHTGRRPWQAQLSRAELIRGWIFFALYLFFFPWLMGWVQRSYQGEFLVAEANVVYYFLLAVLTFVVFWSFLRRGFGLLLDWLPENLLALVTGLIGAGILNLLVRLIPLPVRNPNLINYPEQYYFAPTATIFILVVLMPLVEEPLFRGLLFGAVRGYSRVLGYVLSIVGYSLYCASQFVYAYGTLDLRYLLLAVQYAPTALGLTWCYDRGGSIWSTIALHMLLNGLSLLFILRGWW